MKERATLKPSSSKVRHMARPDFFHLSLSNYVSYKKAFSNVCGLHTWYGNDVGFWELVTCESTALRK
jgi:hypothetical protein